MSPASPVVKIVRHPESWIPLPELGKSSPPYRRTFLAGDSSSINAFHEGLISCPLQDGVTVDLGIPGWQRREDSLKLYELAYYIDGDILELGCFHGLSTTILARALEDAKKKTTITSVDHSFRHLLSTRKNLRSRRLRQHVRLRLGDARKICRKLVRAGRKFGLVFVDDSHSYDSVLGVCRFLPDLLREGGFCLFHDYNDIKNIDPNNAEYGVAQAVQDGLPNDTFEFYGIFGCCALYRKNIGPLP